MTGRLISNIEAAKYLGFPIEKDEAGNQKPAKSFYNYCRKVGIDQVPFRKGVYDTNAIDTALNKMHGLSNDNTEDDASAWLREHG